VNYIHHDIDYGNGTRLWDASGEAVTALSKVEGRRVLLLFTDGQDEGSRITSFNDVLARARAADIMVYSIGFHSVVPAIHLNTSPDRGIKTLAEQTGGGYFELSKAADLNSTFTRVADELHRQYVMAFTPQTLDGKVHVLKLTVDQPGLVARARTSYVATPSK
jgi:VWFA-related protein